jgi:hypothetical protein
VDRAVVFRVTPTVIGAAVVMKAGERVLGRLGQDLLLGRPRDELRGGQSRDEPPAGRGRELQKASAVQGLGRFGAMIGAPGRLLS